MFLNSLLLWLITKVLWSGATSICDGFISFLLSLFKSLHGATFPSLILLFSRLCLRIHLLISVLYTAHSLMTTNACWLYSMHATCFTAFSLYATCILHFLCIQCLTMHPCWFIHLQPHVMVCTLKIFWERAHVLTRRDTLLSKDVYILCSGAVPVGWLEDPEGYLARRSPD